MVAIARQEHEDGRRRVEDSAVPATGQAGGDISASPRAATLRDVAALSGVAVSTASRALTRPGRVSGETEARVRAAAEQLGYAPSGPARALLSGRTGVVALVVPDVTNPFFFSVVRGTQSRLRQGRFAHLLVDTEESPAAEERALRDLRGTVDGAVLAGARLDDERLAHWARELPIVTINRSQPADHVVVDTPGGAVQALRHLVSLGHRRIGYAGGPPTSWSDGRRRAALAEAAAELDVDLVDLGSHVPRREGGALVADAVVTAGVSGVVVFNDLLAFGVLARLAERGVEVPAEVSVVGCDDVFGADLVRPALTTVAVPSERAAYLATDLLLTRLEGTRTAAAAPPAPLPTHLVVRGSTAPARTP